MPSLSIARSAEPPADAEAYARAQGTFYHLPQWGECLRDMYRFRLEWYSARAADRLVGLLPIAEVPGLLGPRRLVSLPFSYAAGALALDAATADALAAAVRERAEDRGIRRIERFLPGGEHGIEFLCHRARLPGRPRPLVWREEVVRASRAGSGSLRGRGMDELATVLPSA